MFYQNQNMLSEQDWWASITNQMKLPNQKNENQLSQEEVNDANFDRLQMGAARMKYRAFIDVLKKMNKQNATFLLQNFLKELIAHSDLSPQEIKRVVNIEVNKPEPKLPKYLLDPIDPQTP